MDITHTRHAPATASRFADLGGAATALRPLQADRPMPIPMPRLSSQALLGPHQEIEIEHGAAVYRLRRTSLGKLILTK